MDLPNGVPKVTSEASLPLRSDPNRLKGGDPADCNAGAENKEPISKSVLFII